MIGDSNTIVKGRNYNGTALPTWLFFAPAFTTGTTLTRILTSANATATNVSDSSYNNFPIYVVALAANTEKKGRWADVTWASGGVAQVQCSPAAAPFQYTKVGQIWFPWVASAVPII